MVAAAHPSSDDFEGPPNSPPSKKLKKKIDEETIGRARMYRKFIIELKTFGVTDDMLSDKKYDFTKYNYIFHHTITRPREIK